MNLKSNQKIIIHILGILVFLSLPVLFSPDFPNVVNLFKLRGFWSDFTFHLLMLLFFYVNYFWLSEKLMAKGKYLVYTIIVVATFFIFEYTALKLPKLWVLESHFKPSTEMQKHFHNLPKKMMFKHNRFFGFDFAKHLFQFTLLITIGNLVRVDRKRKLAENEKTEMELNFLKSQIQPHFLFNTLNGIYALSLEKSEYTPKAIVKLSEMMRYVLYDSGKNEVKLEQEINYLKNYIELQHLRLTDNVKLKFDLNSEPSTLQIAPMILVTFIENAFKYGVSTEIPSRIEIELTLKNGNLHLKVYNDKVNPGKVEEVRQIGLKNTISRLNLLYENRYQLNINDNELFFEVNLNIQLK
ncbi:MAG TPA: sensor histidine kinase [Bacteroidia bacterium]